MTNSNLSLSNSREPPAMSSRFGHTTMILFCSVLLTSLSWDANAHQIPLLRRGLGVANPGAPSPPIAFPTKPPTLAPTAAPVPTAAPNTGTPTSTTEAPTGDVPTTEAPTGAVPTTEAPTGDTSTTEAPTGIASTTEAPTGDASTTEAPTGDASTTEAPTGVASTSEAPAGDASTTEAPTGALAGMEPEDTSPTPGNAPTTMTPTDAPVSASETEDPTTAPTPEGFDEETIVSCDGNDSTKAMEVWYRYSITMYGDAPVRIEDAIKFGELQLQVQLIQPLLGCGSARQRKLNSENNIVGIDYKPDDITLDGDCPNGEANCSLVRGLMNIYLTDAGDWSDVVATRKAIRDILQSDGEMKVSGVKSFEYLAPELEDDVDSIIGESDADAATDPDDGTMNTGVTVIAALGSFLVVLGVVAAFRYKRGASESDEKTGVPETIATCNGSHITMTSSNVSPNTVQPASSFADLLPPASSGDSFAEMLPSAYRMEEEEGMSAIFEDNSDSASQNRSTSDIMVSECGYTEEDSRDVSYLQTLDNDPLLGAQRMEDMDQSRDDEEEDFLYDTGAMEPPIPNLPTNDSLEAPAPILTTSSSSSGPVEESPSDDSLP